jgi:hypothetical protein
MDREEMVAELTANCDCWKNEGATVALNSMPDDSVEAIYNEWSDSTATAMVANAAVTGFKDETLGAEFRLNVETGQWERRMVGNSGNGCGKMGDYSGDTEDATDGGVDEEAEGEPPTPKKLMKKMMGKGMTGNSNNGGGKTPSRSNDKKETNPVSLREWLVTNGTPQEREVWNRAIKTWSEEKMELCDRLTANLAGDISERRKHATYAKLMKKSPEELEELIGLMPVANESSMSGLFNETGDLTPVPVYAGAAGGFAANRGRKDPTANEGHDDILRLPTMEDYISENGRRDKA